ncbi:hypothetical protein A4S05_34890 [Nostoc sp. KVJ20]|uniref:hypothetical protein n=1 Tax=Nostoc sp. KVJ20 TaxID=457944 RepID=UPI00083E4B4A|nr:hypothetical protein [Nostoc sp. KVJ20]ODH00082.1 hypothetical protein A4S05_34890 [Nostoc sp. KVJ20]
MTSIKKSANALIKKTTQLQIGVVVSILSLVNVEGAWGQQAVKAISHDLSCKIVAKVISGDLHYQAFTKICPEDEVKAANGKRVKIFCYPRGIILEVPNGTVGKHCSSLSNIERRGCKTVSQKNCINPKGTEEANSPRLINPFGVVIVNPRPLLSWSSIKTATSYNVQVKGIGVDWEVEVKSNSLPYPADQPPMKPGNVYTVDIMAMRENVPLVSNPSPLILLTADKTQEIDRTINILKSLKQSPDELAIDTDAVYEAKNLVHNSIEVLNARAEAGSSNPKIYRLLGDRYMIAKWPQQANQAYWKAKVLAQRSNNALELALAQAGIEMANGTASKK